MKGELSLAGLCFQALAATIGNGLAHGEAVAFGDFEVVGVGGGDIDGEAARGFARLGGFWLWGWRRWCGLLGEGDAADG